MMKNDNRQCEPVWCFMPSTLGLGGCYMYQVSQSYIARLHFKKEKKPLKKAGEPSLANESSVGLFDLDKTPGLNLVTNTHRVGR